MKKNVLITGAGSGFGKLTALALSERGHHVIATTESDAQASALREVTPGLEVHRLDITTRDVERVYDWDVDVLINNAGVGETGPLADIPMQRLRHLFEVNVFGTLNITQAVLRAMVANSSGRVIIVSSIAGVLAAPGFGPYAMTKHALEAMGKSMRAELAPLGIDVTLVNPGPYLTGFNDRMAQSMWEWFNDQSLNGSESELFRAIGDFVTTDQRNPDEVAALLVELVEAVTTSENNFIPTDLKQQFGLA